MNTVILLLLLQTQAKPSMQEVQARTIVIERKLDRAIAKKAEADAKTKARESALIRARLAQNEKKMAVTRKRVILLENRLARVARDKSRTVTIVRYVAPGAPRSLSDPVPMRRIAGSHGKNGSNRIARKPVRAVHVAFIGAVPVGSPVKKTAHMSWIERLFTWPHGWGQMAASWD